ncbi:MAG: tetratricopeptide repeat protein, partial [Succinivibrionaceae bacterium]|nr:tetratricopeptide repeat protein [Succinivibrionaceae bacterium]
MKWSDTWFKMCDSFNEWKGRLVSEKGLETTRGKKTLLAMCCATAVLGLGVYQGYSWYLERDYLLRAESAMRGGFFKEAFKNYLALAQRGDLEAMRQVADMYFEGKGTAKNPDQAIKFLQEAADQGDSEAMTRLGMLYFSSSYQGQTCLGHDYRQAMNWFLKAGRNPEALEAIGTMYLRGLGVETNERLAQNYFDKWIDTYFEKARQGDAKAQYLMGLYLIDGQRHVIDEPKAIAWFEKSAAQGYVKALESLGFLYRIGGENTAPDNEKAMAYFAKLKDIYEERAAKGDTAAMIYLAEMYQKGEGVPQDNAMALKKYLDASDAGSIAAKENLADLAENNVFTLPGGVTPEDLRQEARKLREQKAVEGDITYMKELGFVALSVIASYESEQANRADNAENEDDNIWAVRTKSQMVAEQKHLEAQEKA